MTFMLNVDTFLRELSEGENLKQHPIIQLIANRLTAHCTDLVIDNEEVALIADSLATFHEKTGASHEAIQNALIAADPRLGEIQEERFHTY